MTTGELRARWRREAIESGHDPDEWVKVVLGQLAAAPRSGEGDLDWDLEDPAGKPVEVARAGNSKHFLPSSQSGSTGGRRRPLPHGPVVAETGRGGAPNQYQDPVEAERRGRSWPEGGDGETGRYGEIAHGGREQDGSTSSRKGADAEEAAQHGGCGQEGDQSQRHREVGTREVDLSRDESHQARDRGEGDDPWPIARPGLRAR